jgi:starch synthase
MKIVFIASEMDGLVKTGGLADVAKALPKAIKKADHDVCVILPYYRILNESGFSLCAESTLFSGDECLEYGIQYKDCDGISVYAIDAGVYFDRPELYAENNQAYRDNGERFSFFCAAALDACKVINFQADVIHCNDWHTGFVPFLLNTRYQSDDFFKKTISVLTIHNAIFKGEVPYSQLRWIPELKCRRYPDFEVGSNQISMLKVGVAHASKVNAVSPTYAKELLSDLGSHGMGWDFQQRSEDLSGIVNGCDYQDWDPSIDGFIAQKYKANKHSLARGKKACKRDLQKQVELDQADVPVYGMVCRLTEQKGLQYLLPILSEFLKHDLQLIIVGTGDPVLAAQLREISILFSEKFAFVETYSNSLAHCVEAGSDFFLMPSEFEPCGLNQIYSLAYGTLPIVRAVGGLKDTVIDYDCFPRVATGFVFNEPTSSALLICLLRSLLLFCQQPNEIKRLQQNAMALRFEWQESADQYISLYEKAIEQKKNDIHLTQATV